MVVIRGVFSRVCISTFLCIRCSPSLRVTHFRTTSSCCPCTRARRVSAYRSWETTWSTRGWPSSKSSPPSHARRMHPLDSSSTSASSSSSSSSPAALRLADLRFAGLEGLGAAEAAELLAAEAPEPPEAAPPSPLSLSCPCTIVRTRVRNSSALSAVSASILTRRSHGDSALPRSAGAAPEDIGRLDLSESRCPSEPRG